jgi:hypothetical protein
MLLTGFEETLSDVMNAPAKSDVTDCDGSMPSRIPLLLVSYQTTPDVDGVNPEPLTVVVVPIDPEDGNRKSAGAANAGDEIIIVEDNRINAIRKTRVFLATI